MTFWIFKIETRMLEIYQTRFLKRRPGFADGCLALKVWPPEGGTDSKTL